MYKVFLCHASEDKPVAERIELALSAAGYRVFYDEQGLPPGGDFHARIERAILECDLFIFLISASSIAVGKFTLTELKFARKRWPSPIGRVLPVNLQNLPPKEIPAYLTAATLLTVAGNPASEVRAAAESMCAAASRKKLRRIAVTIAVVSLALILSLTVWRFTHSPTEAPVVPAGAKAPIASSSASFATLSLGIWIEKSADSGERTYIFSPDGSLDYNSFSTSLRGRWSMSGHTVKGELNDSTLTGELVENSIVGEGTNKKGYKWKWILHRKEN
jgi:hypothetical protein